MVLIKLKITIFTLFLAVCSLSLYAQDQTHDLIVKGVDSMMIGNYAASLELLTEARAIAEEEEDYKNLFVSINNIGLNYHKLLDTDEALKYYLEAYTLAIKELDDSYEMTSLNNIAILYSQEKNLDKAIEYFKKAYELSAKEKDPLKRGIYAINLAQVFSDKEEFLEALPYLKTAIDLLKSEPDYLLEAQAAMAILEKDLGNIEMAKVKIEHLLPQLKEKRHAENRVALMLALSEIESYQGHTIKSLELCKNALSQAPINIETRHEIFSNINRINRKSENYKEALVAMDSMSHLKQVIYDLRSGQQYQANKVKFDVLNYESQLTKERQQNQSQRMLIIVILSGALIIIFLLIWALRLARIRNKQRKDLLHRQEKILNLELENEKANNLVLEKQLEENKTRLLLEQEQHKHEIASKNRKLSARALFLTERNKLVESIIQDLEQSDKIKPVKETKGHIKRLKSLLKEDEEWGDFAKYFDEVNHGLLKRLKNQHENLNANDMRFISYLYMNLSMKEIASIMNITPDACRKRKERISKKMELSDKEDLYSYISQL